MGDAPHRASTCGVPGPGRISTVYPRRRCAGKTGRQRVPPILEPGALAVPQARLARTRLFARASAAESRRLAEVLRRETVGGVLLVAAAVVALVWANSPWGDAYETLRDTRVG